MNSEKEKIFRRIREALTTEAPQPGHHAGEAPERSSATVPIPRTSPEIDPAQTPAIPPPTPPETDPAQSPEIPPRPSPETDPAQSPEISPEGLPDSSRGRKPPVSAILPPRPGGAEDRGRRQPPQAGHVETRITDWLPPVKPGFDAQADLFGRNSVQLKSTFHLLENESAAAQKLAEIARAEAWKRVAAHGDGAHGPSTRAMVARLALPGIWTDTGYDVREMENCDAGVTECDALIAQTGSVLVTGRSAGGRALSVLPPHHVVLARRDQLVADLPAAFALLERKYAQSYPSFIGFITGPSRTGDIERILVLGAHGPKKLTILCW